MWCGVVTCLGVWVCVFVCCFGRWWSSNNPTRSSNQYIPIQSPQPQPQKNNKKAHHELALVRLADPQRPHVGDPALGHVQPPRLVAPITVVVGRRRWSRLSWLVGSFTPASTTNHYLKKQTNARSLFLALAPSPRVRRPQLRDELRGVVAAVVGDDGGELPQRPREGLHRQRLLPGGLRHARFCFLLLCGV